MSGPDLSNETVAEKLELIEEGTADAKSQVGSVSHHRHPAGAPAQAQWTSNPPIVRLVALGHHFQSRASEQFCEVYPRVLDTLKRILRLFGLMLAVIFVVMIASWIMAVSHWFTVVFGHFFLRYSVPATLDDAFATKRIEFTAIFAALGAFLVNLPPFIIFLLSFPLTFDRSVFDTSSAPVNEFIRRITPNNRFALMFIKFAPRLAAGPIGCALFLFFNAGNEPGAEDTLDPLHAAMAGLAGEVVLSCLGKLKDALRKRFGAAPNETAVKDSLPM